MAGGTAEVYTGMQTHAQEVVERYYAAFDAPIVTTGKTWSLTVLSSTGQCSTRAARLSLWG